MNAGSVSLFFFEIAHKSDVFLCSTVSLSPRVFRFPFPIPSWSTGLSVRVAYYHITLYTRRLCSPPPFPPAEFGHPPCAYRRQTDTQHTTPSVSDHGRQLLWPEGQGPDRPPACPDRVPVLHPLRLQPGRSGWPAHDRGLDQDVSPDRHGPHHGRHQERQLDAPGLRRGHLHHRRPGRLAVLLLVRRQVRPPQRHLLRRHLLPRRRGPRVLRLLPRPAHRRPRHRRPRHRPAVLHRARLAVRDVGRQEPRPPRRPHRPLHLRRLRARELDQPGLLRVQDGARHLAGPHRHRHRLLARPHGQHLLPPRVPPLAGHEEQVGAGPRHHRGPPRPRRGLARGPGRGGRHRALPRGDDAKGGQAERHAQDGRRQAALPLRPLHPAAVLPANVGLQPRLRLRPHPLPAEPGHEERGVARPRRRRPDVEVHLVLCRLLHHRPLRPPRRLHPQRRRHGPLHDEPGHHHLVPQGQHRRPDRRRLLHLPLQHLCPHRLPRRQLSLLHRDRPHPPPHGHVLHLDRQPLALELHRRHGHPRRPQHHRVAVLHHLRRRLRLHPRQRLLPLPRDHGPQPRGD